MVDGEIYLLLNELFRHLYCIYAVYVAASGLRDRAPKKTNLADIGLSMGAIAPERPGREEEALWLRAMDGPMMKTMWPAMP